MGLSLFQAVNIVSQEFDIDIRQKVRYKEYVYARMIYFYIAKNFCKPGHSLARIGSELASSQHKGWDHASVIHNLTTFQNLIDVNQFPYQEKLRNCKNRAMTFSNVDSSDMIMKYHELEVIFDELDKDLRTLYDGLFLKVEAWKAAVKKNYVLPALEEDARAFEENKKALDDEKR